MALVPLALLGLVASFPSAAQDKQLLWGDTHLHSSYSADAYLNNNYTADPETAYRYARGLPVIHPYHRARVQLKTPLDFLVVSDHAEFLGVIRHVHRNGIDTSAVGWWQAIKAKAAAWYLARQLDKGLGGELFKKAAPKPQPVREAAKSGMPGSRILPPMDAVEIDTWRDITRTADEHNNPGIFTALIGWEWSSTPGGANLHRVVITDGDAASAQKFRPFSARNSQYPEDLWAWLDALSETSNAEFLAIPHNSNLSKGFMFDQRRLRGTEFDAQYIANRKKWEPIVEITQIKGDSETHPDLSPNDPFADFEEFPFYLQAQYSAYQPKAGDYVRSALKRGLSLEKMFGENPYQYGVIGSTDSHTGLAGAEEENFMGKLATDSIPENKNWQREDGMPAFNGWSMSASGLAAVWASDNTREAIVAAMKRREVYATTGPRIRLQFSASAKTVVGDIHDAQSYQNHIQDSVLMGGELTALEASPMFTVLADKDPLGANLDRVQIVKGWLDAAGRQREQVFNVAWSGERSLNVDGSLPAVGNTVDLVTGHWDNDIGAAQLRVEWRDPLFNPEESAFYYVRILQIPTPRHSLYDAIALRQKHAADHPDTIQERAYSSPIWYSPVEAE